MTDSIVNDTISKKVYDADYVPSQESATILPNLSKAARKDYKSRKPGIRIFVNRSVYLENIKFYGFDMDYTIAEYCSPQYEKLIFDLGKDLMVEIGYPADILEYEYDPSFPVRGLWFDSCYGNLIKADAYGNILVCVHGFRFMKSAAVQELYPNNFLQLDEKRIYVLNTLFHLPEMYLLACLMDYFSNSPQFTVQPDKKGIKIGDLYMSYHSIFQDVRKSITYLHVKGELKQKTIENLSHYIKKNSLIPKTLNNITKSGGKVFLLTNSDYLYTNSVMTYLFDFPHGASTQEPHRDWKTYFDVIIVDASKPLFFSEGTVLRQVDEKTGSLKLGMHVGELKKGQVYSGGCCEVFMQLTGCKGRDVLYFGDHIYGDILKSKKRGGWRTFLIVPEMIHELTVWTEKCQLFSELQSFDITLSEMYKDMDSSTREKPDITEIRKAIRNVTHRMDMAYGMLGSIFRSGSRQTFFSDQVQRFADLYAASFTNLAYYPLSYMFRAPAMLMPHESTVTHEQKFQMAPIIARQRTPSMEKAFTKSMAQVNNLVPQVMPREPKTSTQVFDVEVEDNADSISRKSENETPSLVKLREEWEKQNHHINFDPTVTVSSAPDENDAVPSTSIAIEAEHAMRNTVELEGILKTDDDTLRMQNFHNIDMNFRVAEVVSVTDAKSSYSGPESTYFDSKDTDTPEIRHLDALTMTDVPNSEPTTSHVCHSKQTKSFDASTQTCCRANLPFMHQQQHN